MKKLLMLFIAVSLVLSGCEFDLSVSDNDNGVTEDQSQADTAAPETLSPVIEKTPIGNTDYHASKIVSKNADGEELSYVEFYYDEQGKLIRHSTIDLVDPSANLTTDFEYDDQGRITTEMQYFGDVLYEFTEYTYSRETWTYIYFMDTEGNSLVGEVDESGDVISNIESTFDAIKIRHCDPEGNLIFDGVTADLYYDDYGNLVRRDVYTNSTDSDKYVYRYDESGRLLVEACFTEDLSYEINFEYDENGKLLYESYQNHIEIDKSYIKRVSYEADGDLAIETAEYEYYFDGSYTETCITTYNDFGIVSRIYKDKNGDMTRDEYTYNDKGYVTKFVAYDKDGNEIYYRGFSREYDDKGNITENTVYNEDGTVNYTACYEMSGYHDDVPSLSTYFDEDGSIAYTVETEFDPATDRIISTMYIDDDGTQMHGWEYDYDDSGKLIRAKRYENGALIGYTEYKYTQIPGIYHEPYDYAKDNLIY